MGGTIIILNVQMKKLRSRKVHSLSSHKTVKSYSQVSNLGHCVGLQVRSPSSYVLRNGKQKGTPEDEGELYSHLHNGQCSLEVSGCG